MINFEKFTRSTFTKQSPEDAISICLCLDLISVDVLNKTLISAGKIKELDDIKKRREVYQQMMMQMDDEQLMEFYRVCTQDFEWIQKELEKRIGKIMAINCKNDSN